MRIPVHRLLLASAFVVLATAVASALNESDHAALIARMRQAALAYADQLQDFVCTQITTRSTDRSGSGRHWKKVDVQEFELSYLDHKLYQRLLTVDGKAENADAIVKKGYGTSRGEFEGFRGIFSPTVGAQFKWDHEAPEDEKRVCVFRYDVSRENSMLRVGTNDDRQRVAHHGFVHADCETGAITRVETESEPRSVVKDGRDVAITLRTHVRYAPVRIGSKEFLLPQSAETTFLSGTTLNRAEIQFQNYRKFQADSKIVLNSLEVE